jgi:hypothetical protein
MLPLIARSDKTTPQVIFQSLPSPFLGNLPIGVSIQGGEPPLAARTRNRQAMPSIPVKARKKKKGHRRRISRDRRGITYFYRI